MPGPPPINVSISSLTTALASRLGINLAATDFWNTAELDLYVRQAIREFQVLTGFWRGRVQIATTAGDPFVDLHATGAIPYTVQDLDVLAQVGFHLLEYSGTGTPPYINTTQFNIAALTAALDHRREEILGETRLVVTEYASDAPGPSPPASKIILSSGVIQVHRCEWWDAPTELWSLVSRTDEIGAFGFAYGWTVNPQLIPNGYSMAVTRPFELQFFNPPWNTGRVSILITACDPYTYTGTGQLLNIPDDSAYALPWGILASVLSQDAQSRDYRRAMYAQKRFRAAIDVLKTWPCVMNTYPQGLQYPPSSLFDLDHWLSGWRNTSGLPSVVAIGGRNLVACSPVPDDVYNIAADCVVNSPASTPLRTTNFSMPGDVVTAILNNAYHLACFKLQGQEFDMTLDMYQDFLTVAEHYADRERAEAIDFEALRGVTKLEEAQRPYEQTAVEA